LIAIRPAGPDDFDLIWPLLRGVFAAGDTYAVDPHMSRDQARDYWMGQGKSVFVAETGGHVIATYYIKANQAGAGAHICNCGYIVDPSARGQGIAAQLCLHSQAHAQHLGYRAMQFNFVLASNAGAVRLWRKLGFATIGTIPDAFEHPTDGMVDAFIMHKKLTP
jgi:ribosomal protein S18 acetylase RimI-like enzyme